MATPHPLLLALKGRLIVSVQAQPHEPLYGTAHMAAMARAAVEGGAAAIRCESPADVQAIRAAVPLPLIGLWKVGDVGVYITPTAAAARGVADAGADIIALDATARPRPEPLPELIHYVRQFLQRPVLADVSTLDEALAAEAAGADAVAPTLSGYTGGAVPREPDWALLSALIAHARGPVIMEGRIWSPADARKALELGAWAVVVGSAITRPQLITQRFVEAVSAARSQDVL